MARKKTNLDETTFVVYDIQEGLTDEVNPKDISEVVPEEPVIEEPEIKQPDDDELKQKIKNAIFESKSESESESESEIENELLTLSEIFDLDDLKDYLIIGINFIETLNIYLIKIITKKKADKLPDEKKERLATLFFKLLKNIKINPEKIEKYFNYIIYIEIISIFGSQWLTAKNENDEQNS